MKNDSLDCGKYKIGERVLLKNSDTVFWMKDSSTYVTGTDSGYFDKGLIEVTVRRCSESGEPSDSLYRYMYDVTLCSNQNILFTCRERDLRVIEEPKKG